MCMKFAAEDIIDCLPLVELAVNEILRLVCRGLGRECDELRYELFRHALRQLVGNGQRFASTGRTNHQNLKYHIRLLFTGTSQLVD